MHSSKMRCIIVLAALHFAVSEQTSRRATRHRLPIPRNSYSRKLQAPPASTTAQAELMADITAEMTAARFPSSRLWKNELLVPVSAWWMSWALTLGTTVDTPAKARFWNTEPMMEKKITMPRAWADVDNISLGPLDLKRKCLGTDQCP